MPKAAHAGRGDPSPAFTVKQFAAAKNLSVRTVWRMIAAGKIRAERYSERCVRIVEDWPGRSERAADKSSRARETAPMTLEPRVVASALNGSVSGRNAAMDAVLAAAKPKAKGDE